MVFHQRSVFCCFYPLPHLFAMKNDALFNNNGDGVGELAVKLHHIVGMVGGVPALHMNIR